MKKIKLASATALAIPAVCILSATAAATWAQNTPCVVGSTVVTCSGNQATGVIDGQNGVTATKDLVVNNLTTDIGPIDYNSGYNGILHFANSGSNIDHITVTADIAPYKISAYATGIKLGFSESVGAGAVELSQSGKIQVYGPSNHGIHAAVTGAEGKPAGAFQIGVAGSIVTDADTSTSAVGLLVEGIGGDGGTGKAGGAGPNFNGPDALTTTGGMTILSNGAGVGSDGSATAGAHGVFVLGQGGDGGDGQDEGGFASGGAGGAGGNAAGTGGAWTIGGADAGGWEITTKGDYSNAFRIVGEGGAGGKGGHADGAYDGGHGGAGGSGAGMFLFYADPTPPQVLGTTHGDYAPAFHFVSQGGRGGNGGGGYGGGSGAKGGDAGDIYLGEDGRQMYPTTYGDTSHGFYIHSQGGDGGNGIAGAEGDGGDGGAGGLIQTFLFFESATSGAYSPGFAAYSTGGGGGKNGKGGFLSTSGSDPGDAAKGGDITLYHWGGTINTAGPGSEGLIAQSVGGHAGSASGCTGFVVCFGANGGSAGPGGVIDVTNNATIVTLGDESVALMAQSHGGGGGNGGTAFGAFYAEGGSGGYGGAGGDVTVDNSAKLSTAGNDATGLYAQSIGGSGGDGGSTVAMYSFGGNGGGTSAGGDVTVTNSAAINAGDASLAPGGVPAAGTDPTCGTGCSHGIFAQSVGGGGGNSGTSVGVYSIGGSGGGGGAGGMTTVTNTANVSTHLDQSKGILAHSVGGGGGAGGGTVAVSAGVALALGGSGGSGGNGNKVSVNSSGATIQTSGASSHAISAQSVGGGGGHGGFAISLAAGVDDFPVGAISVGGTGGSGGSADTVTVCIPPNTVCNPGGETGGGPSSLVTTGDGAHGLVAQSIGGGGGDGGFAISVAGGDAGSAAFAVGGKGKNAGHGAAVTVDSDAAINTSGDNSLGLYAQSIGGGGGHGGFAASGAFNFGEAGAVALSFGGSGGGGGSASTVDVTNSGTVGTKGDSAPALIAQSIAGGGGNGGLTLSGTFSPTDDSYGAALSFGGSGGSGGVADTVTIDNTGNLTTGGDISAGIIAQSIGGGGGNGSMSISGTVQGPDGMTAAVSHGGTGGDGGDGGGVSVTNTAVIMTGNEQDPSDPADATTSNSHGIVAQSIGGGGGNGGLAGSIALGAGGESQTYNLSVAVGGNGGEGGKGGDVYVAETQYSVGEPLTTYSEQSYGVFAQSIGGGGGNGGSGISGSIEVGASMQSSTVNAAIAVGGKGGTGQTGGHVELYTDNVFTTYGDASHAIYLSSIGGGGGTGGSVKTLAYNLKCVDSGGSDTACQSDDDTDGTNYNVNIGIGGNAGSGNDGGQVVINSVNSVHTFGDGATGIYAQSIGGGGGDGGDASGINTGDLAKEERTKNTTKVVLYVGGTGAGGGDGGYVALNEVNGSVTTEGVNAPAIFAQSIGGGGGKGGTGITSTTNQSTLTFGGSGKAAGDGGAVLVQYADLSISTGVPPTAGATDDGTAMPDGSYGIFAQSVGGGGGSAGNPCLAGKCNTGNTAEDIAIGVARSWLENSGGGGNGGAVQVQSIGDAGDYVNITTYADNAIALLAQSVGGGGGTAGTTGISMADGEVTGSIWGSTGGDGVGQWVTVDHAGAISTIGDGATGIFAQSAGGKGTLTSAGADVTVSVDGPVKVSGTDASAIFAQSVMLDSVGNTIGAGSSHVTIATGSKVQGGLAGDIQSGAGVEIRDGVSNTVTNNGTITSLGGDAIVYVGSGTCEVNGSQSCQTSVSNTGLIDGNVVFGGPGGGMGTVDNSGRIIGAFVDRFAGSPALPAASATAETATRVMNREDGEIVTAGITNFDQITNYGRIEVEGDGGAATFTHAGDRMVHTGSGSVILDLWDSAAGGPFNDRLASTGIVSFDFGSSLSLEAVDGFRPESGSMFDLMLAEDLRFGTERDADFDLFDYVSAPFLNRNDWALSLIDGYGSFENVGLMAGLASPELLRLTRVAPIPLPGSLFLYGSALLFAAAARRQRRQTREC